MAKSGRRAGSSTRTVYTGSAPRQKQTPIYGKTPSERIPPSSSSRIGRTISGCDPRAHTENRDAWSLLMACRRAWSITTASLGPK
jgi:hypothetical protein